MMDADILLKECMASITAQPPSLDKVFDLKAVAVNSTTSNNSTRKLHNSGGYISSNNSNSSASGTGVASNAVCANGHLNHDGLATSFHHQRHQGKISAANTSNNSSNTNCSITNSTSGNNSIRNSTPLSNVTSSSHSKYKFSGGTGSSNSTAPVIEATKTKDSNGSKSSSSANKSSNNHRSKGGGGGGAFLIFSFLKGFYEWLWWFLKRYSTAGFGEDGVDSSCTLSNNSGNNRRSKSDNSNEHAPSSRRNKKLLASSKSRGNVVSSSSSLDNTSYGRSMNTPKDSSTREKGLKGNSGNRNNGEAKYKEKLLLNGNIKERGGGYSNKEYCEEDCMSSSSSSKTSHKLSEQEEETSSSTTESSNIEDLSVSDKVRGSHMSISDTEAKRRHTRRRNATF